MTVAIDRTTDATQALAAMQVALAGLGLTGAANTLLLAQDHLQDATDKAAIGKALVFIERAQTALSEQFSDE